MPDGLNLKLTNSALSAFMEKFDKDKSKVEVKKNEIVIDFDGDGRADQSINMKTKDLKYGYSDYQNGVTKNSKADGKYTYIDFDGDGRMDAKIKSKKLSKNNMSDPITLKGNSREVQELIEQRYVLDFAYQQVISKEVPDLKEGQKIKKMMAAIDKKLNSYNAGVGTEEFKLKNDAIQVKKEPVKVADNAANGAAPVDVVDEAAAGLAAAEAKKKKAEEKKEIGVDSKIMVTNALNKNGTIDGTVTNIVKDDKGKITSFSLKSAKGNDFNYEYDAKTDRYVNKKENKYYIMQEDGSLVRDNKLGQKGGGSGGGDGKPKKVMAASGSGRYSQVVDGVKCYFQANGTKIADEKTYLALEAQAGDIKVDPKNIISYGHGRFGDKQGNMYTKTKDNNGNIIYTKITDNPAQQTANSPNSTASPQTVSTKDWSAELNAATPSKSYNMKNGILGVIGIEDRTDKKLLEAVKKGDDAKLAAQAIIASSKGLGTNDLLFKTVLSSIKNESYYKQIETELKNANMSMGIEQYINSEFKATSLTELTDNTVVTDHIKKIRKERLDLYIANNAQNHRYGD